MTMLNRKMLAAACVVVVASLVTAASSQAGWGSIAKMNYVTFNKAVALPGVVLAPGTYTFEQGPPGVNVDIVRVTTRDGRRTLYMGFTRMVTRPDGLARDAVVTLGEAVAGEPQPIAVWFPLGHPEGRQFIYR